MNSDSLQVALHYDTESHRVCYSGISYGTVDDVLVLAGLAIVGMTLGFGILGLDFFGQRVAVATSESVDALAASRS